MCTKAQIQYVFLDVVGFTSGRTIETQSEIIRILNDAVTTSLQECAIPEEDRILIPTGDGMAIALIQEKSPTEDLHLRLAKHLLSELDRRNKSSVESKEPSFEIRIGINEYLDNIVSDINGNMNVAGEGISMAQRIMDLADGSQILAGERVHGTLKNRNGYTGCWRSFHAALKHGNTIRVYQYCQENVPGLNTNGPELLTRCNLPPGFLILINGASGVGKSTLARALASKLNVSAVFVTDYLREVYRNNEDYPLDESKRAVINTSSYLAHLRPDPPRSRDKDFENDCIEGFKTQSKLLVDPLTNIARRLIKKGDVAILEGVNIIASDFFKRRPVDQYPKVLLVNLFIEDEKTHKIRIMQRGHREPQDEEKTATYIKWLECIRHINRFLRDDANNFVETGAVATIDNGGDINEALKGIENKIRNRLNALD